MSMEGQADINYNNTTRSSIVNGTLIRHQFTAGNPFANSGYCASAVYEACVGITESRSFAALGASALVAAAGHNRAVNLGVDC